MQFGAMNFPLTPLQQEIDTFAKLGFDYIEIAMDPPMAHYSFLSANKKAILRSIRNNDLGIVCHLPTFVSTADLTESLRKASIKEMLCSLETAADLGAEKVVLHPSMVTGLAAFTMETTKALFYDFLSQIVPAAQRLHITLCLENMMPRNILGVEPVDFEEILKDYPSLKLTLDTGHANLHDSGGNRLKAFVKRLKGRIAHLHFSDNLGRRDEHLAVGEGTVHFATLVRSLKEIGYDETITLEIFDSDRRHLVKSRETIKNLLSQESLRSR